MAVRDAPWAARVAAWRGRAPPGAGQGGAGSGRLGPSTVLGGPAGVLPVLRPGLGWQGWGRGSENEGTELELWGWWHRVPAAG